MARRPGRPLCGLIQLNRSPEEAGIGPMGVQEIDTGSSDGRLAFRFQT